MKYMEYDKHYESDVKNLILELQNYIVGIDEDKLNILTDKYKDEAFNKTIVEIKENQGKIFIAVEKNKCVGFVAGIIHKYEKFDYLDYKCPKKGEITELIVTNNLESKGIGSELISLMENYFKSENCEYISLDVFSYNSNAIKFYTKKNYHSRLISMIKKI